MSNPISYSIIIAGVHTKCHTWDRAPNFFSLTAVRRCDRRTDRQTMVVGEFELIKFCVKLKDEMFNIWSECGLSALSESVSKV